MVPPQCMADAPSFDDAAKKERACYWAVPLYHAPHCTYYYYSTILIEVRWTMDILWAMRAENEIYNYYIKIL